MLTSKAQKPCFYISLQTDVTELMAMRPKLRKSLGVKITTNTFYIRALALAAAKYPLMVAKLDGDYIKIAETINVGFAVNAPHGLVVPVVKEANKKILADIAREEKLLTEKARSNKLTLDDMENETIALSNLGVYGIDSFIGIIPPPASAILSVGNVSTQAIAHNGGLAKRKMLSLSLALDHRVVDGAYAAKFLNTIAEELTNPESLINN